MENKDKKRALQSLYRRLAYMGVAIIASMVLFTRPVFSFQDDRGIKYVRSFTMTDTDFFVTQTELDSNISHTTATMSIRGLYYCNQVMLWGAILCLLCFFSNEWRVRIATLTAFFAGVYYVIMVYYAIRIADEQYATLYPNLMAFLPAVVCQMMILTRQNVLQSNIAED